MIRKHVIGAVFRRNFLGYFRQPTGYVFIAVFIILSAMIAFFREAFFGNNLANLDTLNEWFPYLLLFFVPAVAMGTWAEERKQGTDELLLTLPATDLELLLGKYFAALGVYGVAIACTLLHVAALLFLGVPDLGVMLGTYLGYAFLGASLLTVGMTASLLTSSMTVAFILGAVFCAVPVFLSDSGPLFGKGAEKVGVRESFDDFTKGVLSLQGLIYFVGLAAVMLYINLALLTRRRGGFILDVRQLPAPGLNRKLVQTLGLHHAARTLSLVVIVAAFGVLAGRAGCRADLTSERLHSLTKYTREVLGKIDAGRPVQIQAFISPEVPPSYVQARKNLLDVLREVDAMGGDRVNLRIVETEDYTAEAREAEQFGIKSEKISEFEEGERETDAIFMGVAFTSGTDEVVLPFVHRGLSAEYEVARSIGTVCGVKRKRVGIASTDAKMFGGFEFQTMQQSPEWLIVAELKKQYEVVNVSLDQPLTDAFDCLLVAMPSSLTQPQMDALAAYMKKGNPTLLFDDPYPSFNPGLSPDRPKQAPGRGMFGPPPSEPKGDIRKLLDTIGVSWAPDTFVWDTWNPYPPFREYPREVVFLGSASENKSTFNPADPITKGLQEMVLIFPGEVQRRTDLPLTFTPLLATTRRSGVNHRSQVWERSFFGERLNDHRPFRTGGAELTLAARIEGTLGAPAPQEGQPAEPPGQVKAVFVADLDCISDVFFNIRRQGMQGLNFDNVTFVLNCVDVLAGDASFVELRKRRPRHRTLEAVEKRTKAFEEQLLSETQKAEDEAKKELDEAQKRFDAKVAEVEKRTDLDNRTKNIMIENLKEVENKRLEAARKEIEDKKEGAIKRARTTRKASVDGIRRGIKIAAVASPTVLGVLICLLVFARQLSVPKRTV
jgi:ABC-2 type transport system permease protein